MKEMQSRIIEYGEKLDQFSKNNDYENLHKCLEEIELFAQQNSQTGYDVALNYYLGTGYGNYSDYLIRSGRKSTESEVRKAYKKSMYHYRKALSGYDNSKIVYDGLDIRILTNYANELDEVGRVIEALRIYRKVLKMDEKFSIARGNYGRALRFLANMVNDEGHRVDLHCYAYQALKTAVAIKDKDLHEQAIQGFNRMIAEYESMSCRNIVEQAIEYKEYSLGEKEEAGYRRWCLKNHLFLNPLNEVIEIESAFAYDPLNITKYTGSQDYTDSVSENSAEPPRWFAMINQLKEEYVYSRYLCYEGMEKAEKVHFADKDVKLLLGSYDYCNYSIRIEQLKSAFKNLYAMFDQIGYFVNDFWRLGANDRTATVRYVYNSNKYPKDNIALGALYWVFSEFIEKYGDTEISWKKHFYTFRNAMEHKFIKVHKYEWNRSPQLECDKFYHISEEKLKKNAMRLLELAREALMYLVYAVEDDEQSKEKAIETIKVPMHIAEYPDEWKL